MPVLYILLGGGLLLGLYLISTYNRFVGMRTQIEASIQEIGNQLKRQAEMIPNLEASAKGYLKHETKIFEQLTDARKAVDEAVRSNSAKAIESAQSKLSQVLPKLQVLVESNPEIKGAEVVTKLMNELRDTADKVMYSRRTLIDLVQDFNQMVVSFPSNMVAKLFGMAKQAGLTTPDKGTHLSVSEAETKGPKINL